MSTVTSEDQGLPEYVQKLKKKKEKKGGGGRKFLIHYQLKSVPSVPENRIRVIAYHGTIIINSQLCEILMARKCLGRLDARKCICVKVRIQAIRYTGSWGYLTRRGNYI